MGRYPLISKSERATIPVVTLLFALTSSVILFDKTVALWVPFAIFAGCMVMMFPMFRPYWAARNMFLEGDAKVIRLVRNADVVWEMPWADLSHWIRTSGELILVDQSGRHLSIPSVSNLTLSAALAMHRPDGLPVFEQPAYKIPRFVMAALLPGSLVGLAWSTMVLIQYMALTSSDAPNTLERLNALSFLWVLLGLFASITGFLIWVLERLATRTNPQVRVFKRSENPWTLKDHLGAREFSPFSDRVTDWLPVDNLQELMRKERQLIWFALAFFGVIGLSCFAIPAPAGPILFGCYLGFVAFLAALCGPGLREVDASGSHIRSNGNDLAWIDGDSAWKLTVRGRWTVSYLKVDQSPKKQTLDPSRFRLSETETLAKVRGNCGFNDI